MQQSLHSTQCLLTLYISPIPDLYFTCERINIRMFKLIVILFMRSWGMGHLQSSVLSHSYFTLIVHQAFSTKLRCHIFGDFSWKQIVFDLLLNILTTKDNLKENPGLGKASSVWCRLFWIQSSLHQKLQALPRLGFLINGL